MTFWRSSQKTLLQLLSVKTGENYVYLVSWGLWGFYSSIELTFVSCAGRCFLSRKIIINGLVLRNPSHTGILSVLGFYWLGIIVGCKLFPFRIPWKSLNSHRSHVTFGICPPCAREYRIHLPLVRWSNTINLTWMDLSSNFSLFSCPLTPWIRHLLQTDSWSDGIRFVFRETCIDWQAGLGSFDVCRGTCHFFSGWPIGTKHPFVFHAILSI